MLHFIEQHKAGIITFLLSGIVVLASYSIHLKQYSKFIAESYYELESESKPREERLATNDDLDAKTNKAFNEDKAFKDLMNNFKSLKPNDFEETTKTLKTSNTSQEEVSDDNIKSVIENSKAFVLKEQNRDTYNELKEQLKKRLHNKVTAEEHAKTKSSLSYSLKGRTLLRSENPRYLCELGGKIVVNIRVNEKGYVTKATFNESSTSSNPCLTDHAIGYAESVRFDVSEKVNQIGTITFLFKAKN